MHASVTQIERLHDIHRTGYVHNACRCSFSSVSQIRVQAHRPPRPRPRPISLLPVIDALEASFPMDLALAFQSIVSIKVGPFHSGSTDGAFVAVLLIPTPPPPPSPPPSSACVLGLPRRRRRRERGYPVFGAALDFAVGLSKRSRSGRSLVRRGADAQCI